MKETVVIATPVYQQIMQLLGEKPKVEVVGLNFGTHENLTILVRHFEPMKNLDNSAVSFSLDYEILFKEIQSYEKKGEILIGIFHSHPEGARLYPSQKDIHFMSYWPYPYLWLIGRGGTHPELAIFTLFNKKITRVPFKVPGISDSII
ncbi:MAG: Mov34/MPN/PAD-1 family protein [Candidatus Heimdallarchaeota archaeon]|nr:MAG: Mov34/MPN/PAD-1 family protein [Candidatus Heimdallarchaeota archaeon]